MSFENVFPPPFKTDPGQYEVYIWCDGGKRIAFNLCRTGLKERIVSLLNGEKGATPFTDINISENGFYILCGRSPILFVRGWGYLTGRLKLDPLEATKIQRDFVKWTAKKLMNK